MKTFLIIILSLILLVVIMRRTKTNNVKEVIYEHGLEIYMQHKFLFWTWWRKFAEGGRLGTLTKDGLEIHNNGLGKHIRTQYKKY